MPVKSLADGVQRAVGGLFVHYGQKSHAAAARARFVVFFAAVRVHAGVDVGHERYVTQRCCVSTDVLPRATIAAAIDARVASWLDASMWRRLGVVKAPEQ